MIQADYKLRFKKEKELNIDYLDLREPTWWQTMLATSIRPVRSNRMPELINKFGYPFRKIELL
jgi:hypothetical protein